MDNFTSAQNKSHADLSSVLVLVVRVRHICTPGGP